MNTNFKLFLFTVFKVFYNLKEEAEKVNLTCNRNAFVMRFMAQITEPNGDGREIYLENKYSGII